MIYFAVWTSEPSCYERVLLATFHGHVHPHRHPTPFGNMLFLLIFGLRAEEVFKIHEYLIIYFPSGPVGNLLTLLFGPFALPSVGASGAIFGMLGACTIYVRYAFGQSIVGALMYSLFWLMMSAGHEADNLFTWAVWLWTFDRICFGF
ncbi:MAG: rhomboid family intramembrane serine protease [Candidatus Bathyarchaeia archaeon]